MPIVRWDPFSDLVQLRDEIGRWFEGVEKPREKQSAVWAPEVDIKETEKEVTITADLPGMKMEDIEVSVDEGQLVVKGERKLEKKEEEKDYIRVERSYGSFYRSFNIGVPVKEDQIKASYKDGVLEVVLPKAEAKKPKKIAISGK
ncbi:MAG: Hsp20/alpha crystallin family protein [Actinomycetia bacterium]|nr:Hsp20/alpha crystallin family protein [Actinomycetes bacterium]